jgi:hypothetical protein
VPDRFGVRAGIPSVVHVGFVFIIAAYASGDGALSLMLAVTAYDQRGSGALVFEALVRIGVGVFALALPGVTALWPLVASGDAVDPRCVIGPYALLFGFTLALRLRQLALEIAEET